MIKPFIRRNGSLRESIGDARMQVDRRLHPIEDVQVKGARCAAGRKRTNAAKPESERGDRNVSGHQPRDRRPVRLVDLADEHQRQVQVLGLDEPQPCPAPPKRLGNPFLFGGYRVSRRVRKFDRSKQSHRRSVRRCKDVIIP